MKNKIVFKMSFTGIMFGLVLLFQFLEHFMPFGDFGFVKFNLTLAFILVTIYVAGVPFAVLLLILRFAFGPLLNGNYTPGAVIGQIILLVAGIASIAVYWIVDKVLNKTLSNKNLNSLLASIITTLAVSLVMTVLNMLIFTPWFLATYDGNWRGALSLTATETMYKNLDQFYFFIPSYWGGTFTVYFIFNIINLAINFVLFRPLRRIANHLQHAISN